MTLEPCPFCGGTDAEVMLNVAEWPAVQCNDCGARGPCIELEKAKAAESWNNRANSSSRDKT